MYWIYIYIYILVSQSLPEWSLVSACSLSRSQCEHAADRSLGVLPESLFSPNQPCLLHIDLLLQIIDSTHMRPVEHFGWVRPRNVSVACGGGKMSDRSVVRRAAANRQDLTGSCSRSARYTIYYLDSRIGANPAARSAAVVHYLSSYWLIGFGSLINFALSSASITIFSCMRKQYTLARIYQFGQDWGSATYLRRVLLSC